MRTRNQATGRRRMEPRLPGNRHTPRIATAPRTFKPARLPSAFLFAGLLALYQDLSHGRLHRGSPSRQRGLVLSTAEIACPICVSTWPDLPKSPLRTARIQGMRSGCSVGRGLGGRALGVHIDERRGPRVRPAPRLAGRGWRADVPSGRPVPAGRLFWTH